jgi:hypothetical protein
MHAAMHPVLAVQVTLLAIVYYQEKHYLRFFLSGEAYLGGAFYSSQYPGQYYSNLT